jgi:hypothetical protein
MRIALQRLRAFGCVAALLYRVMPTWGERLGRVTSGAARRLPPPLSAPAKGAIVFLAALALSRCAAALLRRVPAIARVI